MTKRVAVSGGQTPGQQLGTGSTNTLTSAPVATASITSYPFGSSERYVSLDSTWPTAYGVVRTTRRHNDGRSLQIFEAQQLDTRVAQVFVRWWNDTSAAWDTWTSTSNRATDSRVGVDTYVGTTAPTSPRDGDLWVSPGADARAYFASCTSSSVQSIASGAVTAVTMDTATDDALGMFSDANDGIIATIAGVYTLTAQLGYATGSTGYRGILIYGLTTGGTSTLKASSYLPPSTVTSTILSVAVTCRLAAGDLIQLKALHTQGANLNTATINGLPVLTVARVGG